MADPDLVIALNAVHTVTGHATEVEHQQVGSGTSVMLRQWRYDCTCGELGGSGTPQEATQHVADVRGHTPVSADA